MEILIKPSPDDLLRKHSCSRHVRYRFLYVLAVALSLLAVVGTAHAQASAEYAIKGAFLVKFGSRIAPLAPSVVTAAASAAIPSPRSERALIRAAAPSSHARRAASAARR